MPTPTYTPLANLTLSGSASSVTFSSISQAYRDLVLVVSAASSTEQQTRVQLNNNASSLHNSVGMYGDGSATGSFTTASLNYFEAGHTSTGFSSVQTFNFMDYSATDKHKSALFRTNNTSVYVYAYAGRFASTSAIDSIKVYPAGGTFSAGSTFALYGIAS